MANPKPKSEKVAVSQVPEPDMQPEASFQEFERQREQCESQLQRLQQERAPCLEILEP